jgi:hypothetical protein
MPDLVGATVAASAATRMQRTQLRPGPTGTATPARMQRMQTLRRRMTSRLAVSRRAAARRDDERAAATAPAPVGLVARLWPTDRPVYKRPAAIGVVVVLAGGLGWWLLRGRGGGAGVDEQE